MKKIGLFYSTQTAKTAKVAEEIQKQFGKAEIEIIPVEEAWNKDFEKYSNIIVGTSTWFDGELPTCWDELVPELESLKLKDRKVAIFGLGNQVNYPENFIDGVGILAEVFEGTGAKIIGITSSEGYSFIQSRALRDGNFLGLAIDLDTQRDKNKERIKKWVEQLTKEFD